jgi:hypothetical protein
MEVSKPGSHKQQKDERRLCYMDESSCGSGNREILVQVMAAKGGMRPHFNAGFWKLIHTEAGGIREVAGMGNSPAEEERCGTRAGKHKKKL